jgi:hypothetical protein
MNITDTVQTDSIKERLKNLEKYLPGQTSIIYDFAKYFAEHVPENMSPITFNMQYQAVVGDLSKNIDADHKHAIPPSLHNRPHEFYRALPMLMASIAQAVCEKEFAEQVDAVYTTIEQKMGL